MRGSCFLAAEQPLGNAYCAGCIRRVTVGSDLPGKRLGDRRTTHQYLHLLARSSLHKRINGGLIGIDDRKKRYASAMSSLSAG